MTQLSSRATRRRSTALVSLFAVTAALIGGGQALVPSPAAAYQAEPGDECDTWLECSGDQSDGSDQGGDTYDGGGDVGGDDGGFPGDGSGDPCADYGHCSGGWGSSGDQGSSDDDPCANIRDCLGGMDDPVASDPCADYGHCSGDREKTEDEEVTRWEQEEIALAEEHLRCGELEAENAPSDEVQVCNALVLSEWERLAAVGARLGLPPLRGFRYGDGPLYMEDPDVRPVPDDSTDTDRHHSRTDTSVPQRSNRRGAGNRSPQSTAPLRSGKRKAKVRR